MGFDYLRDNMAIYASELVQRGHAFAIVDEVDSILIDEARTPLIISGMGEKSTEMYSRTENLVRGFRKKVIAESDDKEEEDVNIDADYIVDEKAKTATLTARGVKKAEEYFGLENLSDPENSTIAHHINQAIKAHGTMKRDIDYVIKDGQVVIVDEFTAATATVCTRPSRPRSMSRSREKARRLRPSRSRITSACTASSPV